MSAWSAVEADFQREYRIDLQRELPSMSLRRFFVLLANLSPNAVTPLAIKRERDSDPMEIAKQIKAMLQ